MDGLTEGRIVHYVMPDHKHRPAIITQVFNPDGLINVRVFTDGANDTNSIGWHTEHPDWVTSIKFDDNSSPEVNTWHWIERA